MINLKEFKQAVLQKAMQGKLTKQLPSDGNAKNLLVKIANHKRDLVQAGKLKGYSKPLPPVTDKEIPFKIPDNWEWTKLGNIGSWKSGSTPKRSNFENYKGDIPWVKVQDLKDTYINNTSEHISRKALQNNPLRLNPKNSILMAMYCGQAIGKLGILSIDATSNQACCDCIPYIINNKFLFYYLMSQRNNFISLGAGGVQSNISRTKIIHYPIPLPPLTEQQRIVSKIHKCFLLADTIQKERDLHHKFAYDMKQSLLLEAMKGHLTQQLPSDGTADDLLQKIQQKKQQLIRAGKIRRHKKLPSISKDEIPFKIPKNWKWVKLSSISLVRSGKRVPKGMKLSSNKLYGYIPYLRVRDMQNHTVNLSNLKYATKDIIYKISKYRITFHDIYIVVVGSTVGKLGLIPKQLNNAILTENADRITPISINKFFLFYALISNLIRHQILNTFHQVAQPKLSLKNLRNLILPLPPLPEQHRIVSKLHDLFNTINA